MRRLFFLTRRPGPRDRLYSSWQWGGYLIYRLWPSFSVFDDGRTDFYGPAFVEEGLRAWDACPEWTNIFATVSRKRGAPSWLIRSWRPCCAKERDWKPVYQDRVAVLFEKTETAR